MPYPIQFNNPVEAVRKLYGIQGYVQAQLIDDVIPVLDLMNPPEDLKSMLGAFRALGGMVAPAVAAQYSTSFIWNPHPGTVLTVHGVYAAAADSVTSILGTNDPGTTAFGFAIDQRHAAGVGRFGVSSDGGPPTGPRRRLVVGYNPGPFAVLPYFAFLTLMGSVVNTAQELYRQEGDGRGAPGGDVSGTRDLDPRFRPIAEMWFDALKQLDPRFVITSARRSAAEQRALYARYLRQVAAGEPAYTTAVPGTSAHERGLAVDIVRLTVDPRSDELLHEAGRVWQQLGGRWGGDADPIHFGAPRGW